MRPEAEIRERLKALRPHKSSPYFLRGIGKVKQPEHRYDHVSGTKAVYISALEWVLSEQMRCPHCGVALERTPETVENQDEGP